MPTSVVMFYFFLLVWNIAGKPSVLNVLNWLMVLWSFHVGMCCAWNVLFNWRSWNCSPVQSVRRNFQLTWKWKLSVRKSMLFLHVCFSIYVYVNKKPSYCRETVWQHWMGSAKNLCVPLALTDFSLWNVMRQVVNCDRLYSIMFTVNCDERNEMLGHIEIWGGGKQVRVIH